MKRMFVMAVLSGTLAVNATYADGPQGPIAGPNTGAPQAAAAPQGVAASQGIAAPQGAGARQGIAAPQGVGAPQGGPQGAVNNGGQVANANPGIAAPNGVNNGQFAGQPGNINGAQANVAGGTDVMKGFAELRGRLDGQGLGVPVIKEAKAPENAASMVNYLFHFCRFRAAGFRCPPGMPMPMPMQFGGWMPAPFGDMELVNVGMVADATPQQGPIYRVTMFNNSPMPARFFHVSLIAVLGDFNQSAQVVTVPVREVAANGTTTVDVQMPIGVMSMGNPAAPFERIIAIVDSLDELAETNELNNVATITRSEVVCVTVTTEVATAVKVEGAATTAAPPADLPPPVSGPAAAGAAPAPAASGPVPTSAPDAPAVAPAPAQGGSPQLDLDKIEGAAQLLGK